MHTMVQPFEKSCNPRTLSVYWDFGGAVTIDEPTPQPFKAITVSASGIVYWENLDGDVQSFYCAIPGQLYPIRGRKIVSGTTATGIYWAGGL